jgi:hypothetical protein
MSWVIKNVDGHYWSDAIHTWVSRLIDASRYQRPDLAHAVLSMWRHPRSFELNRPRLVRLKRRGKSVPVAAGAEARIRKAERERIADYISADRGVILFGGVAIESSSANAQAGQLRQAIVRCSWGEK